MSGWTKIPARMFTAEVEADLIARNQVDNEYVNLFEKSGTSILVPRDYAVRVLGCENPGDSRPPIRDAFPSIQMREYQVPALADLLAGLEGGSNGGLLLAPCGTGKTVVALEVINLMRRTTLVVVHKTYLLEQWEERFAEFLPGLKVGVWQQDRMDSPAEHDVIIGMMGTMVSLTRDFDPEYLGAFGLMVVDEVHRSAAATWQRIFARIPAKYRLGLTATIDRRDGMEVVIEHHLGPVLHEIPEPPERPKATIVKVALGTNIPSSEYIKPWYKFNTRLAKLNTALAKDEKRQDRIVALVVRALKEGRRILVLGDRKLLLTALEEKLALMVPEDVSVVKFVGGASKKVRAASLTADVVLSTFKMADEALDIAPLDTLFMCTIKADIRQAVGRILRIKADKKPPLVLDFVDVNIKMCLTMWGSRLKRYDVMDSVDRIVQ